MPTRKPGANRSPGRRRNTWWVTGSLMTLAVMLLASACGTSPAEHVATGVTTSSTPTAEPQPITLPGWVLSGSQKVRSGYIAATLHAAELEYIPCYCSCGQLGHTAVIDCFIAGSDAAGAPVYDNHAYY